jgi:hypothetical protein
MPVFVNRNRAWMAGMTLVLATAFARGQAPCTKEQAWQTPGTVTLYKAQQADNDRRYGRKPDPAVMHRVDQTEQLLRKAFANLRGANGKYEHQVFDPGPHTQSFQVVTPFFFDYCVAVEHDFGTGKGGKIIELEETGSWIYIHFNTLGWLTGERRTLGKDMRTPTGQTILRLPIEQGEWNGHVVYSPVTYPLSAAILLTPAGRFPFRPVSREEFLLAREGAAQKYQNQSELQDLQRYRASMSPAELQSPAIVANNWSGNPYRGSIFAKDAQHGERLVTVDKTYIDRSLPKSAVQLIVLYWTWSEETPAEREFIRQFRSNFDVGALQNLLDR